MNAAAPGRGPVPGAFECTCDAAFCQILWEARCSLAVSTFQAGKLIFLSPQPDGRGLIQLPRHFDKPMGFAVDGDRMAVATRDEVVVLANARDLARVFPDRPGAYDGLFIPRAIYFTGELDLHDMAFQGERLWGVNTRFSCVGTIDASFSFTPVWRPPFVTNLRPEDRCHLNGFVMGATGPEFATALGTTDVGQGWRGNLLAGGVLMHVPSSERVINDLPMPHSPRWWNDRLLLLLSATGELVEVDPRAGRFTPVAKLPGFVRGLAICGETAFVGVSKLRSTHRFAELPVAREEPVCGVAAVDLKSGTVAGWLRYRTSCEEIYDVQILEGLVRPGILERDHPFGKESLSFPGEVFWTTEPLS